MVFEKWIYYLISVQKTSKNKALIYNFADKKKLNKKGRGNYNNIMSLSHAFEFRFYEVLSILSIS